MLKCFCRLSIAILFCFTPPAESHSQEVHKNQIRPNWTDGNNTFWYHNDLRGNRSEYIFVDAEKGTRSPAFDHARLADALRSVGVADASAESLSIQRLRFDNKRFSFVAYGSRWECDSETYKLLQHSSQESPIEGIAPAETIENHRDAPELSGEETVIRLKNTRDEAIQWFWIQDGKRRSYGRMGAGKSRDQHTFAGHIWEAATLDETTLAYFVAGEGRSVALVDAALKKLTKKIQPRKSRRPTHTGELSPDGKWKYSVRDGNIYLIDLDDKAKEICVTSDGTVDEPYGSLEWSPDSKSLVVFKIKPGENTQVHLIESSPSDNRLAKLTSRAYPLPGDRFTSYQPTLISTETRKQIKIDVDLIDFGQPGVRWSKDSKSFSYEKVDRGHQRFRLVEVDARTGLSRNIIDEKSETFIWTAHNSQKDLPIVSWLDKSDELIYLSEQNGWRHLYLVQAKTGQQTPITSGNWIVRSIDRIDESSRRIWFQASGIYPNQDPYLLHFCRVNFDGTDLTFLTAGNGTHSIAYSPDRRFFIDTFSRVDLAPVHELRREVDGQLLCQLETADISELKESGWTAPEVFSTKGRDDKTDIWGIICRPKDFDPTKRYPIIEDIYAGPHDAHVPKRFRSSRWYSELTDRGFVVVKIDGMGTAQRSKAFHDVCWKNLKDAGFPDRIRWIQDAAKKYPALDSTRVGIYGTSAGGQNAAGALLFHGDFYKAAVASCGCHDNRMDKASWNEQWMGYPVLKHYSECSNIDNAHLLQGHLMLIVGELDSNVPPESTLRLVDALVKADKDFEMLVIPGMGHSDGGKYGQRRRLEFFQKHLMQVD